MTGQGLVRPRLPICRVRYETALSLHGSQIRATSSTVTQNIGLDTDQRPTGSQMRLRAAANITLQGQLFFTYLFIVFSSLVDRGRLATASFTIIVHFLYIYCVFLYNYCIFIFPMQRRKTCCYGTSR